MRQKIANFLPKFFFAQKKGFGQKSYLSKQLIPKKNWANKFKSKKGVTKKIVKNIFVVKENLVAKKKFKNILVPQKY